MIATRNGWTIEGTPREIAELIGTVPACSLYETPEWNRTKHDTIYKTGKEALKGFEWMHKAEAVGQEQANKAIKSKTLEYIKSGMGLPDEIDPDEPGIKQI